MADAVKEPVQSLSSWWRVAAIVTMAAGFAVLILLTVKAYQNAPPIPEKFVDPAGTVVFTADDVIAGQQIFLKHGLMDNGTIWGHGAYLGPDFSAQSLHILAVALDLKANRYDPQSRTLALPAGAAESFNGLVEYWTRYFDKPERNGGLARETVSDPRELHQLTAFFAWTAWASAALRPGTSHSYTNNFPYDPLAGNTPTAGALIFSALSLVFLLAGTAAVLLAFGKFDYLGWHRRAAVSARAPVLPVSDAQLATLKFMAIAALLFFGQTLIGGGVAHYRADPGSFYGIDLAGLLPGNLLRTWHLQLAILWIATAYVGGALFVAGLLGRGEPAGQRGAVNLLFGALLVVVLGSLLGEWAGLLQWLGNAWFWFGNQGWEYLEIGRFWQILLALGLIFWFGLLWRAVAAAWRDPERRARQFRYSTCLLCFL